MRPLFSLLLLAAILFSSGCASTRMIDPPDREATAHVQFDSRMRRFDSGIPLRKGREYRVIAYPGPYGVKDLAFPNNLEAPVFPFNLGFNLLRNCSFFGPDFKLRVLKDDERRAHFLTLIGQIGPVASKGNAVVIGRDREFTAWADGDLHLFLNDWNRQWFYQNNRGVVSVFVYGP